MRQIRTSYDFTNFPAMDAVIEQAVGRKCDFAGSDFSGRDMGWVVQSEVDEARITRGLRKLNLNVRISDGGSDA